MSGEVDLADILNPYQGVALALDDEFAELIDRFGACVGGGIRDREGALHLTRSRLIIIGDDRRRDIGRRDVARGHPARIEPETHRERLLAKDFRLGHAGSGLQDRLHDTAQVIRDLRLSEGLAGEAQIERIDRITSLFRDDRIVGFARQLVFDLIDLGQNFGQRFVGVIIEDNIDRDRALALGRGRGDIVDSLRARDRLFERVGDEPLHQFCRSAGIACGHRDDGVLHLRILPQRYRQHRARADEQDQDTDDRRKDRSANKNIGERHGAQSLGSVAGGFRKSPEESRTIASFDSFNWPDFATTAPASTPSRITTLPSNRGPVLT